VSTLETTNDIAVSLARGRYAVMSRASALMRGSRGDGPVEERGLQELSGLLMTALEELKVAEEELRLQNATLEAQRAGIDERTRYYRQLFAQAPMPVIVTDPHGSIVEVNADAATLLRRTPQHLERKPIAALIPPETRDAFRQQFARLASMEDGVTDWRFPLMRTGEVPTVVHACVRLVRELGPMRSGVYYWALREAVAN
jgi:PAS domain S-box-containing protein